MLKKIIAYTAPPKQWKFIVILVSGVMVGLVAYALYVSNAVECL